jgi:hypothetical protein
MPRLLTRPRGTCPCGSKSSISNVYCLSCHARTMREWRKTHPLKGLARLKMNARSYLHVYVKKGYVKKLPCEVCGDPKSQGHHHDYSKPIDVRWLCKIHHCELHSMQWRYRKKRGRLIHDGDCRLWSLKICTCGLLHWLAPSPPTDEWFQKEMSEHEATLVVLEQIQST